MKRTAIRRISAKHWKKALDDLCREVTLLRDKECQWCGKAGPLQWCHVRSRRYLSTRWAMFNVLGLCAGCHLRGHHQPLEFAGWFEARFPDRAAQVRLRDQGAAGGKIDRELIRLDLENERRKWA